MLLLRWRSWCEVPPLTRLSCLTRSIKITGVRRNKIAFFFACSLLSQLQNYFSKKLLKIPKNRGAQLYARGKSLFRSCTHGMRKGILGQNAPWHRTVRARLDTESQARCVATGGQLCRCLLPATACHWRCLCWSCR